ncbi:MAG: hypothetical protein KFF68_01445 [Desulfosarcina sp.]|nr:hypothetical protein [Desulfosarcina sp.]
MKADYSSLESVFDADHVNYWSNLSRFNNLMVICSGMIANAFQSIWAEQQDVVLKIERAV